MFETHHRTDSPRVLGCVVAAVVATTVMAGQARAQDEGPNLGAVSVSGGVDFVTQYWFRGMAQENQGFISQPWIDVAINLGPFGLDNVDVYGGFWGSIHSGTGSSPANPSPGASGFETDLFEADFYAGVSIGLPANFALDVAYVTLTSPAFGGIFADEVDITLAYDDAELWGEGPLPGWTGLQPYVMVAIETQGGSDVGVEQGTYLEIGIAPGFTAVQSETYPIDISVPMTAGFSIEDYYETNAGSGIDDDDAFGFFDIGLEASMPLSFMPAEVGSWSVYAGVHAIFLGNSTQEISGPNNFNIVGADSDVEVYGVFGVSMEY